MSSRLLTIRRDNQIVVIRGYKAAGIARAAGLRPTYSAAAGGWMLDAYRLPELVAWLEYRNYRYALEGDEPLAPARQVPDGAKVSACEPEATLW